MTTTPLAPKAKETHRTWDSFESLENHIQDVINTCTGGYEVGFQKFSQKLIVIVYMGTKHGNNVVDRLRVFVDIGKAMIWDEYVAHHKGDSWSIAWDEPSMSMICNIGVQCKDHEAGRHDEAPETVAKDVVVKLRIAWGSPSSKF